MKEAVERAVVLVDSEKKQIYLFLPNKCLNSMEGLIGGQQPTKSEKIFSVAFPFTPKIIWIIISGNFG